MKTIDAYTPPPRRALTDTGRQTLAAAVTIDHNWDLPFSGVDKLIAALDGLTDEDLRAAGLVAHYLDEAVACVQIRRDMERVKAGVPSPHVSPSGHVQNLSTGEWEPVSIDGDAFDDTCGPVPSPGPLNHGDADGGAR